MFVHRLFTCTIGWTETPIVRLVVRHGLEAGDFVLLVRPTGSDEKADIALQAIRDFLVKMLGDLASRSFRVLEIDPLSPISSIKRIREVLEEYEVEEVIAILSGGMRALLLETLLGILFSKHFSEDRRILIEVDLEGRNEYIRLDSKILKLVGWKPSAEQRKLMNALKFEPKPMRALAEELEVNVSTVYRWFKELEARGLMKAEKDKESRAVKLRLTDLSELVI